jgi:hypothetical protein
MSPAVRLAAFALAVAAAFGGGAAVGGAVGPEPDGRPSDGDHGEVHP